MVFFMSERVLTERPYLSPKTMKALRMFKARNEFKTDDQAVWALLNPISRAGVRT